jgi:hypothetical protein
MQTFTIDEQNSVTVFATKEEAAGASALAFSSQKELAKLSAEWPVSRFVEIWNGFAGVAPFGELKLVKKFTDRKVAVTRIWQAIQRLDTNGAASIPQPEAQPVAEAIVVTEGLEIAHEACASALPVTDSAAEEASIRESGAAVELPSVAPQVPDVAPEFPATVAEPASVEQTATKQPKRKKAPKPALGSAAPRETKLSQVVAMLQRPEGATISEIMQKMGWLKHTVRGFMAGTMKKAGYNVESFKPEGGERSYRILPK